MYHIKLGELIQSKEAIGKAGYKQIRFSMISSALDFCIVLQKIISLCDPPPQRVFSILTGIDIVARVWPLRVAPSEERTILADCVDLIWCQNVTQRHQSFRLTCS